MAFIDVFTKETELRGIYGVPSKDNKSTKVFILEYLLVKVPEDTLEKSRLIYQYEKYNIGDSVTAQAESGGIGQPVPNPAPFSYLKLDGSNTMDEGYTPTNPLQVITLEYFDSNGTGLMLGETDTTAYRGDRGKIAYDHSLLDHAPSTAEVNRPISDDLNLTSSTTSASSTSVKLLNDNKSDSNHTHDLVYEPINSNIQTHIADAQKHIQYFENLFDTPAYSGNQGKLVKVNATEDGLIFGDPSGTTVSWGDINGTLGVQTDLQTALDLKVDDTQVLTNVPVGALFTDTIYDSTAVDAHMIESGTNPHDVSASNVGLVNVDNTADLDKPVSTATQTALDLKEDDLGNPTINGMVVASLADGTRSWEVPMKIDEVPADLTSSGITVSMTVGEDVTFGALMYVKDDGKLWKGDSDASNTYPIISMAIETISAGNTGNFLLFGIASDSNWTLTIGASIYLDTTPGTFTQIKPTTLGQIIQVIGVATASNRMLFNPNMADIITSIEDVTGPAKVTITEITEL